MKIISKKMLDQCCYYNGYNPKQPQSISNGDLAYCPETKKILVVCPSDGHFIEINVDDIPKGKTK